MLMKEIPELHRMSDISDNPYVLFFEPASMLDRIVNQYALFSVTSDPKVGISDLPAGGECCVKYIIPREVKLEIRDKLDYVNISERMIYPGLDGSLPVDYPAIFRTGPQIQPPSPGGRARLNFRKVCSIIRLEKHAVNAGIRGMKAP